MTEITIKIGPKEIKNGNPRLTSCAIDRGFSAADFDVLVRPPTVTFYPSGHEIPLPNKVKKFIRMFDAGHPVLPFEFTLNVHDEVIANREEKRRVRP